MSMDRTPDAATEPGRTAPVGSSLPGVAGLWTRAGSGDAAHSAVVPEPSDLEVNHERGWPCMPCLDTALGASPNGRATTGSAEGVRRRARLARTARGRLPAMMAIAERR
jgi:hypothetical protein